MITRETLKSFLRPPGSSGDSTAADTISYRVATNPGAPFGDGLIPVESNPDLAVDPNTGRPLIGVMSENGIAQNYVNYITSQIPEWRNEFPIENVGNAEYSSPTTRGSALQPPEGSSGQQDVWSPSNEQPTTTNYFNESGTNVESFIDKLGSNTGVYGPDAISSVLPDDELSDRVTGQSPAVPATFKMLKKYNKYTSVSEGSDFIEPEINSGNVDGAVKYSFQREKGVYQIADLGGTEDSTAKTLQQLVQTAPSLLLKATGWDPSNTAATSTDPQNFIDDLDPALLSQYPSIVSMLLPDQVRARESYPAPTDGEASFLAGRNEAVEKDLSTAKYTLGNTTVYTPDSPFTDAMGFEPSSNPQVAIHQSAISMVALAIIIEEALVNHSSFLKDESLITNGLGPFYMGRSTRTKTDSMLRAIAGAVIANTGRYSYRRCVEEGLKLCLGIDITADGISGIDPTSIATNSFINVSTTKVVESITGNSASSSDVAATTQRLAMSWGFWNAVARSTVRIVKLFENSTQSGNVEYLALSIANLARSKALSVTNVFAQIGYTKLIAYLDGGDDPAKNPEEVSRHLDTAFSTNSIETLPGTRMMKSRDPAGPSALSLAWRHSSIASALLLPPSLIAATLDMDYILDGPNAVKGTMSTSLLEKTYISARTKGRIPIEVVNGLENRLDAEYVPFYFHDMRTNEVIGLHAFLESLTDNYTANYNSPVMHGRADGVKNYNNTKRSIGASFYIVATSPEDFDEMWVKINKLVTLLYPQYTKGVLTKTSGNPFNYFTVSKNGFNTPVKDFQFEQPFSQVVGASPLIRLRIGDVIKSNYSRFALGRIFGAGNNEVGEAAPDQSGVTDGAKPARNIGSNTFNFQTSVMMAPLLAAIASPIELVADSLSGGVGAKYAGVVIKDAADNLLINGFVNPIIYIQNMFKKTTRYSFIPPDRVFNTLNSELYGKIFLKPSINPYFFKDPNSAAAGGTYVKITRNTEIRVIEVLDPSPDNDKRRDGSTAGQPTRVRVKISNPGLLVTTLTKNSRDELGTFNTSMLESQTCVVTLDQCLIDPDAYYNNLILALMELASIKSGPGAANSALSQGLGSVVNMSNTAGFPINSQIAYDLFGSIFRQFLAPVQNPIVGSIEGSMGRGLPGVITSMNFTWLDASFPWDTRWNSRAPMGCKITIGFDPVHDIAPGLDYYGANRAPNYNVGATMNVLAGDPLPDIGNKSKFRYENYGRETSSKFIDENEWASKIANFSTKGFSI